MSDDDNDVPGARQLILDLHEKGLSGPAIFHRLGQAIALMYGAAPPAIRAKMEEATRNLLLGMYKAPREAQQEEAEK